MSQSGPDLWPFSERNGSNLESTIATLNAAPELTWSDAEAAQLSVFSEALVSGSDGPEPLPSLYEVSTLKPDNDIVEIYDDYLVTDGGVEAARALGLGNGTTAEGSLSVLRAKVALDRELDQPGIQRLASASRDWQIEQLQTGIASESGEDNALSDLAVTTLNLAPAALLTKLGQLQRYRQLYRQVQADLKGSSTDPKLVTAQQSILRQHIAKVNAMTALTYPRAVQLAEQLAQSPATEPVRRWQRELYRLLPVISRGFHPSNGNDRQLFATDLLRRMDLVRNGAASGDGHDFTPLSPELLALAAELDTAAESQPAPLPEVPPQVIEYMHATSWDSAQFKTFAEAVLGHYGLLSDRQTDAAALRKRTGPAEDGKWQVVITDTVTGLTTESRTKTWQIPAETDRTLIQVSPAGPLPVTAHELEHVFQDEFAELLAEFLPLAKVKGRRNVTSREMRAVAVETEFQALVGQTRPVNTMYLRALQQKLAGGEPVKVGRAYLEAVKGVETLDAKARVAKAKSAAKGILRLYRHGGQNSQPLDYLEQELLVRGLAGLPEPLARRVSIAAGSFALKDVAELYRHGLLQLPEDPDQDLARDVLNIFMTQFYRPDEASGRN